MTHYFKSMLVLLGITFSLFNSTRGTSFPPDGDGFYLYVGAYTEGEEEGIYVYRFNASQGDLKYLFTIKGIKNPSYLAIHPKRNLLLAVNEIGTYEGMKSGSVGSFRIDPTTGFLTKLSQVATGGGSPCYVSINKSGDLALVANYSGGNVATFSVDEKGRLLPYKDLQQHTGSGTVKGRQDGPHAHSIIFDPKEHFALAADLGINKVISYTVNESKVALTPSSEFALTEGAGPRHLTFHPNKKLAFIINELNSTVTSCTYDAKTGKLSKIMDISSVPDDFTGTNYCADIHVSTDGKFVFGSNRGHNSIVVYLVDGNTGKLTTQGHYGVKGEWPRNFMIDPTGKFLLVANQNTSNIVVFKIDPETGALRSNGVEIEVNKPVCLKMMQIP